MSQTISERASAGISKPSNQNGTTIPEREQPLSEQFRIVARKFCEADAAATLQEELKTPTLEQMKTKLIAAQGDMPDNKAERLVKSGEEWEEYIRNMCANRARANLLKAQMRYIDFRFSEWQSANATNRAEMRLGR